MPKKNHAKKRCARAKASAAGKVSAVKKAPRKHARPGGQARRHSPKTPASNPAPPEAALLSATNLLPKEQQRRERMSIGQALREEGIDEHEIAGNYKHVMVSLKGNAPEAATVQKLFVDVLKECSRQLEASDEAARTPSRDVPVIVHLVHNVPRPERPPTEPGK